MVLQYCFAPVWTIDDTTTNRAVPKLNLSNLLSISKTLRPNESSIKTRVVKMNKANVVAHDFVVIGLK